MTLTLKELEIVRERLKKAHKYLEKIDAKCHTAQAEYVRCILNSYRVSPKKYKDAKEHYEKTSAEQRRAYKEYEKTYDEYICLLITIG